MNRRLLFSSQFFALVLIGCFSFAGTGDIFATPRLEPSASTAFPTKRVTVAITGMDCKGCESGISGELLRTPGVIAAAVSYERQEAVVDYDSAKITPAGIVAAIKGAGFGARLRRN
jgi:copper chaperone CopZ